MTREEALRKLKAWDFLDNDEKEVLETLIPEFQSEGERIRKFLHHTFTKQYLCKDKLGKWHGEPVVNILAWLEKQKEQSNNNVEPEFKVGDWVVSGKYTVQISKIQGQYYIGNDIYGNDLTLRSDRVRFWTIEDAKDGDILAAHECLVLFKEIDGLNIKCHYCTYHYLNHRTFCIDTLQNKMAFHPATKAQRDALMKVIAASGYEWNAEKKKLRKIEKQGEQKDINSTLIEKEKMDNAFTKMMLKGKIKWAEEDNDMLDTIESWLDTLCEYLEDSSSECIPNVKFCINWLESLKQRMEE